MWSTVVFAYVAVLGAEVVGDKTIYTLGAVATRYRLGGVAFGALLAFLVKIGAAVAFGSVIHQLPRWPLAIAGALAMLGTAWSIARDEPQPEVRGDAWRGALATFGTLVLSEWGDPGQLAVVALVVRYGEPWAILLGGTAAMLTKGAAGAFLGMNLHRWIALRTVRRISIAVLVVLALSALIGALGIPGLDLG